MPLLALFLAAGALAPGAALPRVLTLADALHAAAENQPQLRQARATTAVLRARVDEARAPLLPQVTGTAGYQRATGNFVSRAGALPKGVGASTPTYNCTVTGPLEDHTCTVTQVAQMPSASAASSSQFDTFNFFSLGLQANQLIYDFGQTSGRMRAAEALADSQSESERATRLQVEVSVRVAYFTARAQKALIEVARETLANQERHLQQIEGFVKVGTRPEIDLAQARTDRANARVQLITAENGYETAKVTLNNAIGIGGPIDYDVAEEAPAPIDGEDAGVETQLYEALKARPELAAFDRQLQAQELTLRSVKGGYGPSLTTQMSLTDQGGDVGNLAWNWNASVNLTWPLFQGLLTRSQVREAEANLDVIAAQRDTLKLQVRLDVDQARLAVRAAKAQIEAAGEALANARERLRLAEGRYQAGVGSAIELGDAQLALTNAGAQRVQADYNLGTARAQLVKALGRR